jgi:hypothetical protein
MPAAVKQASSVSFTHFGTGTVRMCLPLPTRSTIAQRSSRRCMLSSVSSASSRRRSPQLRKTAAFECSRSGMPSFVSGWLFLLFALFVDVLPHDCRPPFRRIMRFMGNCFFCYAAPDSVSAWPSLRPCEANVRIHCVVALLHCQRESGRLAEIS